MTSHQVHVPAPFGSQLACDAPGVSAKLRPLERRAFFKGGVHQRRGQNVIQGGSGAFGHSAARLTVADK